MSKRTDIKSILIIGAGPIVIGQACEFDYSGTQATRALKEEGYRVILVNSNPATIMTDPDLADATYIEPLTVEYLKAIIKKESPDAILPTVGGQTALNLTMDLYREGILEKNNVQLIGAQVDAIDKAEDRERFKKAMDEVGIDTAKGGFIHTWEEAESLLDEMQFPIIIRPSFTMGGTGGSVAYNSDEFQQLIENGLSASPTTEVLMEESLLGWKEYEMEVVRDKVDNAIIICSIENIDPMGIHTGDSVTVAPAMTLSDKEYQQMRNWSIHCLRTIGVETGGSNVQFAVNPENGRMIVIEMNPRVSRSSALASKATGFPIAKVAAKLAVGYTLDELPNDITGKTLAAFEPTIDYVVTKVPRFDFEKFPSASGHLGVQMQSVGEAMSIGRTFRESLQKAFRSLEVGLDGLEPKLPADGDEDVSRARSLDMSALRYGTAFRLLKVRQALMDGQSIENMYEVTKIDPWFLYQIKLLIESQHIDNPVSGAMSLKKLKQNGYSDRQIGRLWKKSELEIRDLRINENVLPSYKVVDTCAAEFKAQTPYCYSTYDEENEIVPLEGKKIIILGGGPNRIGQGIEFDYCCVQAVFGLQDLGYKTIMVNCNPETVSTDFDLVDRLYFEPVTFEDVLNIVEFEKPNGILVQFGGQTPLKIARALSDAGVPIIGTSPENIDLAEDREKFGAILDKLNVTCPKYGTGRTLDEVVVVAENIGFPVLARPSYVLGGRAMEIVYSKEQLIDYIARSADVTAGHPILIDEFLEDAFEFDVDALSDGESVHIGAIMQHIEEAGIHSGDSACVLPPYRITTNAMEEIIRITKSLAIELKVIGLINLQFAFKDNQIYVLEVNPRASRTIPFVSKTTNVPLARIAAKLAVGEKLKGMNLNTWDELKHIAVKEAVLPFNKFPEESIFLSPEMKSTGEVMGISYSLGESFRRATISAGSEIPDTGQIFISVNSQDKMAAIPIVRDFHEFGFDIIATSGTARELSRNGIPVKSIFKVGEGRPNVVDGIKNDEIDLVINTPLGAQSRYDEEAIGRACIQKGIMAITTLSGAEAALRAIRSKREIVVKTIQEYH
ncbi:MAG: carbamoyl-phosphate synthase large subunit [Candidatus Marinimicrobia bacterium]|jgi:carbamoyl-phosphate synthase large subunit|nr:carbamoyl-phosphate synthase large subunit [Candidatus Neomarinimicrobiota bacterium]MBT3936824.1 carbamoyl-phosphate synthase large subunit [Candidatus Neomarinimicrobiota bacterium]MBT3961981.1 carbamoyl-phosphate synthase large subunit [Candidatus Neomarinimicrobiota bacterium]MBT4383671.1 carbamoyl-phosphate synthase large subunit [Candidatus Neomarinimicrobiota bacterium]MBT4635834.1 carbamoyl-phosphate synthase large subunit [Candidatus Neomarinimicrobiota bacterium]